MSTASNSSPQGSLPNSPKPGGWLDSIHKFIKNELARRKKLRKQLENEKAQEERDTLRGEIENKTIEILPNGEMGHPHWDADFGYFEKLQNEEGIGGEFTKSEREKRREKITIGSATVDLFRDHGMTFYAVRKGDNTVDDIYQKLSKIPEFSYLQDPYYAPPSKNPKSTRNISSFNILPQYLQPGMYVAIPLKVEDRQVNHKQMTKYCYLGIQDLQEESVYKNEIDQLVGEYGEKKLIQIMIAFARSETTATLGQDTGRYALQRYEGDGSHSEYSLTMYHILMTGPGLEARRKLGLTEGQCYHPQNAAKLFLAYWLEKVNAKKENTIKKLSPYFAMETNKDFKKAGRKYCGRSSYGKKLKKNYEYAGEQLAGLKFGSEDLLIASLVAQKIEPKPKQLPKVQPAKIAFKTKELPKIEPKLTLKLKDATKVPLKSIEIGRGGGIQTAIRNANWKHGRFLKSEKGIKLLAERVEEYVSDIFKTSTVKPSDRIFLGKDKIGVYAKFQRGNEISDPLRVREKVASL